MRERLTYSNVMATLAVFCALGGSAYAVSQLPKNSVGAKQIRKQAVRSGEVKNRSLLPKDSKIGDLAGFAYVRVDGGTPEIAYGKGATDVEDLPVDGEYDVLFNRSTHGCVAFSAPGFGFPRGGDLDANFRTFGGVLVDPDDTVGSRDNVVRVQFYNDGGGPIGTSFFITLFC